MPANRSSTAPFGTLILALLLGVLAGGAALWSFFPLAGRTTGPTNDPAATPRETAPKSGFDGDEREAIDLFKAARGSVVNVDTVLLRRRLDMSVEAQQTGTGSGFIWDDDGRIVTNFHVVREALANRLAVRIVLADRTAYPAQIVGVAPDHDLAVLKIDAPKDKLSKIKVGTSRDLEVGQRVYAIGNPFGLSLTLTKGIISALDREIDSPSEQVITGAIQTDAPINPGNSGGPLLDKDGRLIGVNTAIKSPSGGNIGIGFAIPVDTVQVIVPELIRSGKILKPDAGVRLVDQRRVRRAGFPKGVMIQTAVPDGPAAKAGLVGVRVDQRTGEVEPGDLILSVDGEAVAGNIEFARMIGRKKVGDTVKLLIERGERQLEVEVTLIGV